RLRPAPAAGRFQSSGRQLASPPGHRPNRRRRLARPRPRRLRPFVRSAFPYPLRLGRGEGSRERCRSSFPCPLRHLPLPLCLPSTFGPRPSTFDRSSRFHSPNLHPIRRHPTLLPATRRLPSCPPRRSGPCYPLRIGRGEG